MCSLISSAFVALVLSISLCAMFTGVEFCTEDIQLSVHICLCFGGNCQSDCYGFIPLHQGQV